MSLLNFLAVFVGAGLGGSLRYAANLGIAQPAGLPFALSTLAVNAVGALVAGVLFASLGPAWLKAHPWGLFMMTGFLGGLTTFSTFTAEGFSLLERPLVAFAQAATHVLVCLLLFWLGQRLVAFLTHA